MYLELKGKRALFARHELKIERYSYDVPTPSAMLGVLKSIYWKPEMDYIIKKIYVINKTKFELIMSNAQSKAQDFVALEKSLINGEGLSIYRSDNATPRTMNVLTDVHYIIEFEIITTGIGTSKDDSVEKHTAIFCRRVEKGQYYRLPCLGVSEFSCTDFNLIRENDIPKSNIKGTYELGVMLHHIDYTGKIPKPIFYKPIMRDGVIDVNESSDSDRGWFLAELCRFYDKNKNKYNFPVLGYSEEKITYKAVLNKDGKMIQFLPLNVDSKKKIKPSILVVPEMIKGRTSCIKANFLYDNASYIFGLDEKRGEEKRLAFIKKIEDIMKIPNEEVNVLLQFLNDYNFEDYQNLLEPFINKKMEIEGNIVFQLEGKDYYIHELDDVKKQWCTYYEKNLPNVMGTCGITGKYEKLVDMHSLIKGVINSSSFTKLISVNSPNTAFSSYGWDGLDNSTIGIYSAHKYSIVLNWLLRQVNYRVSIDNSTFIFWTENDNEKLIEIIKYLLLGFEKNDCDYDFSLLLNEKIYIAELKANSSRLFINGFWIIDNYEHLVDFSMKNLYNKGSITKYWDFILEWKGLNSLNKNCVAYKLGELFAVLEKSQKDAVKSTRVNDGIVEKNIEKASLMPSYIFPKLLEKNMHHTNKVDFGTKNMITQILAELEDFAEPFPDRLSNKEKCIFFMGYYKKRDALRYKKENKNDNTNVENTNEKENKNEQD